MSARIESVTGELFGVDEAGPKTRWTERDMLRLLVERYSRERNGLAYRHVWATHVRLSSPWGDDAENFAYGSVKAIADFIALDSYRSGEIIGHEVKVSRSDWLAELRNPDKSEVWMKHCHRWYLVTPDADIVRGDLPEGWGHMTMGKNGALRVRTKAPKRENVAPLSVLDAALLCRSVAKTARREMSEVGS